MKQAPTALIKTNLKMAKTTLSTKMDIGRKILSSSRGSSGIATSEKVEERESESEWKK
jgi:hypothetical protein